MSFGAGAAANVVGGELQGWASVLDKWAMQRAYQDEAARQGQYAQQAMGTFGQNLPAFGAQAAQGDLASAAANRSGQYRNVMNVPLAPSPLSYQRSASPGANQVYADVTGKARANLGAYGDWQHQLGIKQNEEQRALNQIMNFARGTAGVFPLQMYKAQHSMDDLAMVGQAISSIGGGAANYAQFAGQPQQQQMVNYGSGLPANTGYNPYANQMFYDPNLQYTGGLSYYTPG